MNATPERIAELFNDIRARFGPNAEDVPAEEILRVTEIAVQDLHRIANSLEALALRVGRGGLS